MCCRGMTLLKNTFLVVPDSIELHLRNVNNLAIRVEIPLTKFCRFMGCSDEDRNMWISSIGQKSIRMTNRKISLNLLSEDRKVVKVTTKPTQSIDYYNQGNIYGKPFVPYKSTGGNPILPKDVFFDKYMWEETFKAKIN